MSAERIITIAVHGSRPAPGWEVVKAWSPRALRRQTAYHRRKLSRDQWLSVKAEGGAWRWKRHIRGQGVQATGLAPTWQAARAAADDETRATWYAQGCPEVLT